MKVEMLSVLNRHGLHARACAKIVRTASRFACETILVFNGRRASARNILAVMLLSASLGNVVRVETSGPEEDVAMREISALFQDGFGERA
jgi:phosphocarrier protein HPr